MVVDPAATPVQRREALMFLVHFVGDMHQPLHCSDNQDKGGNDVKLDFFGRPPICTACGTAVCWGASDRRTLCSPSFPKI